MPKMDFIQGNQKIGQLDAVVLFDKAKGDENGCEVFSLISLTAPEIEKDVKRTPLNISACIDVSGSMRGEKLENVKKSLLKMVKHLTESDILGIVTFDNKIKEPFEPSEMTTANKDKVANIIKEIKDGDNTNISGGLFKSCDQIKKYASKGFINRVILFSDGQANEGITDVKTLSNNMKEYLRNTTLSTFGYGKDYDEPMMTTLSTEGKGNFYHIETPESIASSFAKELGGLLSVFAQNIELTVNLPSGVSIVENYSEDFGDGKKYTINDIYSQETRNILLKLKVDKDTGTKAVKISVAYNDIVLKTKAGVSAEGSFELVAKDEVTKDADTNKRVAEQIVIHTSAKAQKDAMKFANSGDLNSARGVLRSANALIFQTDGSVGVGAMAVNAMADLNSLNLSYQDAQSYSHNLKGVQAKSKTYSTGRASVDDVKMAFNTKLQDNLVKDFEKDEDEKKS